MDGLKIKYTDIYLLRNERIFKIYRFCDGKAIEPDFVLFLTEKGTKKALSFQLFVEPKGQHLLKTDQWKEDFLKEIESHFEIVNLFESDKYRLVGLPFYNEILKKQEFKEAFDRIIKDEDLDTGKSDLYFSDLIPDESMKKTAKYEDYLPVYSLEAVATAFSEEQKLPKVIGWKKVSKKKYDRDYFIAKVVGRSMEPTIADGSPCLFRFDRGGSRNGKIVLVESLQVSDPETHQRYTIKRYSSEKKPLGGDRWIHSKITLSPDNKEFKDIMLENVSEDDFKVVAEFIQVLK